MMSTGECHSPQNKAENNHAQRRFQYKLNVSNGKYTHFIRLFLILQEPIVIEPNCQIAQSLNGTIQIDLLYQFLILPIRYYL